MQHTIRKKVKEATTICSDCSCGCGLIVATGPEGHIINSPALPKRS